MTSKLTEPFFPFFFFFSFPFLGAISAEIGGSTRNSSRNAGARAGAPGVSGLTVFHHLGVVISGKPVSLKITCIR